LIVDAGAPAGHEDTSSIPGRPVRAAEYVPPVRPSLPHLRFVPRALVALAGLAALASPVSAPAASKPQHAGDKAATRGALTQLPGPRGCLVDSSMPPAGCGIARALKGPGPFMGSRAIAVSPDGRNVYVASSRSNAVAVFRRNPKTGALGQPSAAAGCVAAKGASGCGRAIGLNGPNSVAVSANGRNVYVTSRGSNAITAFKRDRSTGALHQLPGAAGCVSGVPPPGCAGGAALLGPDVVVVSPDGANVYVGSFFGNAVAVLARDGKTGALSQPAGAAGCIAVATAGCAPGVALGAPEGMAISAGGTSVYVASALSNAVAVLSRDPTTGALTQATDGSGCIVDAALAGCTAGVQLSGANAVAVAPGKGDVYVTSLFSNSVTSFTRSTSSGALVQKPGTSGCLVWLRAVGCSFGRALSSPEGLAVSPDGVNVYAAAFASGAIAVLDRSRKSGTVAQKPGREGCLAPRSVPGCTPARALRGVSSIALSPDGRHLYSTSFGSDAVDIFRRHE
jgi:DNA-binding beta-propeller fold protein YncE